MNKNKALLIIDMQKGFAFPNVEEIVPKINTLSSNFNGPIIFTKFVDTKESNFDRFLKWDKFQDKNEQGFIKGLRISEDIFEHQGYNTISSSLKDFLEKNKISQVYLSGIYLDVCLSYAAMRLFDLGYEVFIVEDCSTSQERRDDERLKNSLARVIGKHRVVSSEVLK